jgi:hypothetical protein
MAAPDQLIGTAVAIVALCGAAFLIKCRTDWSPRNPAPNPWMTGAASFALSSIYWLESTFVSDSNLTQWISVAWWFVLVGVTAALLLYWSRRDGWTYLHRLAVAGGALLTYVWVGFVHSRYLATSTSLALTGNVLFGTGAVIVLVAAVRAQLRGQPRPKIGGV